MAETSAATPSSLPSRALVGTSGWSYDHWAGDFYPAGLARTRWAAHYREQFPTVELNTTFYRLPSPKSVKRWRDEAPEGFVYAAKGSRYLTHILRLRNVRQAIDRYFERVLPLGDRLGAVLWQLPPSLESDLVLLDEFLELIQPRGVRHAVEFRHPSWITDSTFSVLSRRAVSLVWVSSLTMPPITTRTAELVYLRLHGLEGGYAHDCTDRELAPWLDAVGEAVDSGATALVYFNNDGAGCAPRNASQFAAHLGAAASVG